MDAAGWVSIIAAIGTAVTAILGALALILVRGVKTEVVDVKSQVVDVKSQVRNVKTEVKGVHTIVNQQRTDAKRYEQLLIDTLRRADVGVPVDASIEKETPQE